MKKYKQLEEALAKIKELKREVQLSKMCKFLKIDPVFGTKKPIKKWPKYP